MKEAVVHAASRTEFSTEERCHILELVNTPQDELTSIARARVEPGVTTVRHRLEGVDERYIILVGQGRVEVGDLPPIDVSAGDLVLIPRRTAQRITNTGDGDLVFLCVCTPGFHPDCYEDLEQQEP